jgi:hypothetical protein
MKIRIRIFWKDEEGAACSTIVAYQTARFHKLGDCNVNSYQVCSQAPSFIGASSIYNPETLSDMALIRLVTLFSLVSKSQFTVLQIKLQIYK